MTGVVDLYPTKEEIVSNHGGLQCECCGKSFSNTSARRLHTVKTHRILSCDGDKRIYERNCDGLARTYIYHCPAEACRKKKMRFEGMRNLKQHYMRVHTEKSIRCKCGAMFALRKDHQYHERKRCLLRQNSSKYVGTLRELFSQLNGDDLFGFNLPEPLIGPYLLQFSSCCRLVRN